ATVTVHDDLAAAALCAGVHLPAHGDIGEARARLGRPPPQPSPACAGEGAPLAQAAPPDSLPRRQAGEGWGGGLVGISAHSEDELAAAAAAGADYATFSPIFLTDSKPGYGPALGTAALAAATRTARLPIVALG